MSYTNSNNQTDNKEVKKSSEILNIRASIRKLEKSDPKIANIVSGTLSSLVDAYDLEGIKVKGDQECKGLAQKYDNKGIRVDLKQSGLEKIKQNNRKNKKENRKKTEIAENVLREAYKEIDIKKIEFHKYSQKGMDEIFNNPNSNHALKEKEIFCKKNKQLKEFELGDKYLKKPLVPLPDSPNKNKLIENWEVLDTYFKENTPNGYMFSSKTNIKGWQNSFKYHKTEELENGEIITYQHIYYYNILTPGMPPTFDPYNSEYIVTLTKGNDHFEVLTQGILLNNEVDNPTLYEFSFDKLNYRGVDFDTLIKEKYDFTEFKVNSYPSFRSKNFQYIENADYLKNYFKKHGVNLYSGETYAKVSQIFNKNKIESLKVIQYDKNFLETSNGPTDLSLGINKNSFNSNLILSFASRKQVKEEKQTLIKNPNFKYEYSYQLVKGQPREIIEKFFPETDKDDEMQSFNFQKETVFGDRKLKDRHSKILTLKAYIEERKNKNGEMQKVEILNAFHEIMNKEGKRILATSKTWEEEGAQDELNLDYNELNYKEDIKKYFKKPKDYENIVNKIEDGEITICIDRSNEIQYKFSPDSDYLLDSKTIRDIHYMYGEGNSFEDEAMTPKLSYILEKEIKYLKNKKTQTERCFIEKGKDITVHLGKDNKPLFAYHFSQSPNIQSELMIQDDRIVINKRKIKKLPIQSISKGFEVFYDYKEDLNPLGTYHLFDLDDGSQVFQELDLSKKKNKIIHSINTLGLKKDKKDYLFWQRKLF